MKTLCCVIAALSLATPAFAGPSGTVSENRSGNLAYKTDHASQDACFGMGRSYYAGFHAKETDQSNGTYIRDRKGDNPEQNQDYVDRRCDFEDDED